jgi:hypothetical protein
MSKTIPIKYLTIKLAIASPITPNDGIGPYPKTNIIFKNTFKNTQIIVTIFGNITISKDCKNSFKHACKYPPKVAKAVIHI